MPIYTTSETTDLRGVGPETMRSFADYSRRSIRRKAMSKLNENIKYGETVAVTLVDSQEIDPLGRLHQTVRLEIQPIQKRSYYEMYEIPKFNPMIFPYDEPTPKPPGLFDRFWADVKKDWRECKVRPAPSEDETRRRQSRIADKKLAARLNGEHFVR